MSFVTDFADQAVMLPLALAVAIALLVQGWRRAAAVWALVVFATFAAILVLKLVFLGCPDIGESAGIRTPSGHVAAATVVVGGMATLVFGRSAVVVGLAIVTALLIGWSRLALEAHSLPEVVVGALVGLTGVLALIRFAGPPPPRLILRRVVLIALVVVAVFHGLHFPAEARIRATAFLAAHLLAVCQPDATRL